MNKEKLILISGMVCSFFVGHAQYNLVPNPSFETGPGSPYCSDPSKYIEDYIDNWANAETKADPDLCRILGNCNSSSDWLDYNLNCTGNHPLPHTSDRYVLMGSAEGIRTTNLNQTLQAGHSYILKFRFAAKQAPAQLSIFLTKFNVHWNDNGSTNEKFEIPGIKANDIPQYTDNTWYTIERYITVPYFDVTINNLVFLNNLEHGGTCMLDDVELYDNGCCPEYMLYENTSSLPAITHVTKHIIAGYDAGIIGTSGNVNVLSGQHVTLKGASVSLVQGFYSAPGSVTVIQPDPCISSSSPTLDPISSSIIPNVITPNGDGSNDKFCITAQGFSSYSIEIKDRYGASVFTGSNSADGEANNWVNSIGANYQCMWDGKTNGGNCVSDGTYDYIIKLSNCLGTVAYVGNVYVGGCIGKRNLDFNLSVDPPDSLGKGVSISPNPNNGLFTLQFKESSTGEVSVYNNLGQIVYRQLVNSATQQIDLSSQPKGIYFVKVQTPDKVYTEKVVVQ